MRGPLSPAVLLLHLLLLHFYAQGTTIEIPMNSQNGSTVSGSSISTATSGVNIPTNSTSSEINETTNSTPVVINKTTILTPTGINTTTNSAAVVVSTPTNSTSTGINTTTVTTESGIGIPPAVTTSVSPSSVTSNSSSMSPSSSTMPTTTAAPIPKSYPQKIQIHPELRPLLKEQTVDDVYLSLGPDASEKQQFVFPSNDQLLLLQICMPRNVDISNTVKIVSLSDPTTSKLEIQFLRKNERRHPSIGELFQKHTYILTHGTHTQGLEVAAIQNRIWISARQDGNITIYLHNLNHVSYVFPRDSPFTVHCDGCSNENTPFVTKISLPGESDSSLKEGTWVHAEFSSPLLSSTHYEMFYWSMSYALTSIILYLIGFMARYSFSHNWLPDEFYRWAGMRPTETSEPNGATDDSNASLARTESATCLSGHIGVKIK